MNEHTMKATEATAAAVDLKRHLLLRVSLFALVIGLAAGAIVLQQAVARIGTHIQRTGNTVERLIAGEADQTRDAFRRSLEGMDLKSLDGIGPLLGICVAVEDIYKRAVVQRCFHDGGAAPGVLRWLLALLIGPDLHYRGVIGQYPGVKVGSLSSRPIWTARVWRYGTRSARCSA
jgi:protein-histidine pros-kinase